MSNRYKIDTASNAVSLFNNSLKKVTPPAGVKLESEDARILWDQYTRSQQKETWRDCDLMLVAKLVKTELDIRKYQEKLDEQDAVIENSRGMMVENPLFRILDTLQRRQLSIIRSLGINQKGKDPRTLNRNAERQKQVAEIAAGTKSENSLLASPIQH